MRDITGSRDTNVIIPLHQPQNEELRKSRVSFADEAPLRGLSKPKQHSKSFNYQQGPAVFIDLDVLGEAFEEQVKQVESQQNEAISFETRITQSSDFASLRANKWAKQQDTRRSLKVKQEEEAKETPGCPVFLQDAGKKAQEGPGSCECQLLRSGGLWSNGVSATEHSVHDAYL